MRQEREEQIDLFVTKLRMQAIKCKFSVKFNYTTEGANPVEREITKDISDQFIRDQLVCGIYDQSTRSKLLRERETLPSSQLLQSSRRWKLPTLMWKTCLDLRRLQLISQSTRSTAIQRETMHRKSNLKFVVVGRTVTNSINQVNADGVVVLIIVL